MNDYFLAPDCLTNENFCFDSNANAKAVKKSGVTIYKISFLPFPCLKQPHNLTTK